MTSNAKIISGEPDGATAIAHELDTQQQLVTAGAKILAISEIGAEIFAIFGSGNNKRVQIGGTTSYTPQPTSAFTINGTLMQVGDGAGNVGFEFKSGNTGGYISDGSLFWLNFEKAAGVGRDQILFRQEQTFDLNNGIINSSQTNGAAGAGSPALKLNTLNTLSTAGDRLVSVRNNNIEQLYIHHDGDMFMLTGDVIPNRIGTAINVSSSNERIIGVTDTSVPRTITLSTVDVKDGKTIMVKDESGAAGTNNITVATQGAETIDGGANIIISTNYGAVVLYSDGTNWFSIPTAGVTGGPGDNLGNHIATQALDMGTFAITNVGLVDGVNVSTHATRHVDGGADSLDGDTLDITFTPSNYTPDATPAEANDVDDLAAHLKGIDTAIAGAGGDDLGNHTATQALNMADFNIQDFTVERSATAVSANTAGESIIGVTDTSAPRTITLITADLHNGKKMIIKDESGAAGTNAITVATQGAETIDGAATVSISVNYGVVRLYSDGSNWFSY